MIRTRITELLGIQHPIILAGMNDVAHGRLAAAVSAAGGLGVIGAAGMPGEALREEIRIIKSTTDKPFGVDLLLADGIEDNEERMQVILEENTPVFVSGLGDPGRWSAELKRRGIKIISMVGNVRQAIRCAQAGADIVAAQGHEAGGHTGRIPSFVLTPLVVDAIAPLPGVLAGGVGDGRALAAALMLGAQGVIAGTRFIATREAHCHDNYKEKLSSMTEDDTVITKAYTGKTCRVIRNEYTQEWLNREAEILPFPEQWERGGAIMKAASEKGDMRRGFAPAGQIAGAIHDVPSAAEIVERMVAEAESLLRGAGRFAYD